MAKRDVKKSSFHISIPVKVVLLTGFVYLFSWALGAFLSTSGTVDFSGKIFGFEISHLYFILEIVLVALAATVGAHFFLDKPLQRLVRAMRRAEKGDFLFRAPDDSNDEIGDLSRAFNHMLSRLTDLQADMMEQDYERDVITEQLRIKDQLEEKNSEVERTNKMLEHLVRDLSLIYEIGQEVSSIIDLDELYSKTTDTLKKYLTIEQFAILVFDDRKEELNVKASYGFVDEEMLHSTSFRPGEGISGLVAETGNRIYVKDTSKEARFLNYKSEKPATVSSFLAIPLMYKDEVLGVINFARKGVGAFMLQDIKMLTLVANQIAIAIANANLYTRTRELSVKDELIGINNRRYFQQMLQMEWKRAVRFKRHLSLVMVDVDHFKAYNDTYGHLQGDQCLKQIGQVLQRNLREVDTVARFGGEEFVLLLPDTDKRGAIVVAEKVRILVEGHSFLNTNHGETRQVTISAGISTFPDDVDEMDDLIDHADIALYRAKERGRNRIECFTPLEDEDSVKVEAKAEMDSEKAAKKSGEILH